MSHVQSSNILYISAVSVVKKCHQFILSGMVRTNQILVNLTTRTNLCDTNVLVHRVGHTVPVKRALIGQKEPLVFELFAQHLVNTRLVHGPVVVRTAANLPLQVSV